MRKAWFLSIMVTVMFAVGGCNEEQIEQMDKFVGDANDIVTTGGVMLQSPAGAMLPPDIKLYGSVGLALASIILNSWQGVRSNLMKKTTKAIVKGIEVASNEVKTNPSNPIKDSIKTQMQLAGVYDRGNLLVDRLKLAR